ncbi:PREDICTED: epithelial cell-transforming sequence 2 oncogene-like isoform X2 [Chinchilla lanigera]|uniref:epithelial cell-transforming sequence 2 oncogene-like isoform X2 n=1 Tax=Chinchilla lanigera TaxID=34839 RepID=UPI0006986B61|nr:PREDICTED: epithelial cell-transforming sequence 2 oncogene-like isoform X2 [Chinchilla lanigera]
MSGGNSSREILEMESCRTRFSAWTPFSNTSLNRQLFQERVALISHWFDLWTNKQRQEFLFTIFLRCTKAQLSFVQDWFSKRKQVARVDFSTVLPRFISLRIFSFLNPKDLCAAAQVSWSWKFLTEQDCLWMPKCVKFGWFLPYTPADKEYGAWKHHYIACVSDLDWLTPREAASVYGALNEPKTEEEELQERLKEKCLRKILWKKIALCKKESLRVRPPWGSGAGYSRGFTSKGHPRVYRMARDQAGLQGALEKELVLASLEVLPKRNNVSGSHSYPSLSEKTWPGVHRKDDSSACTFQPHFILISSRVPAYELVVDSVQAGVLSVVYEHSGMTLDGLLYLTEKALAGRKARSVGIFSDGDSEEINLLQGYKIGIKNLLRPEVRDFWEKLGSYVATEEEGGHVDLFVPLGASEAGVEALSQLSQLTGTLFTAPAGIATGSYQHILSEWLGPPGVGDPPSVYFSEPKLQTWARWAELLEDALKPVRKQLGPLLKELQTGISARMVGQIMFDSMSMADVLSNHDTAQALADGLAELSKEHSDKPLEFLSNFLLKTSKKSKDWEGSVPLTTCDSEETLGSFRKKRNVIADDSQDTKSRLSKSDLNFEGLVKLEARLRAGCGDARTAAARELLRSERRYVQTLAAVRDVYATPLRAALSANRAILSAANIRVIFSDVLRILRLNRQFLNKLGDRLQDWGPAHCVGEIFIKFGSQLNTYTNFFNNYPVVLRTIEKCRETTPAFRAFLQRRDKTIATNMLSLPELLLCPSRRFDEYLSLLYALRLHTPAEHVGRGELTAATDQIKKYKDYLDQIKENIKMKEQLSEVQSLVWGCPTLSEVNRYLIRVQDVVQLHCPNEEISFSLRFYEQIRDLTLFLFNDALLISHRHVSHAPFERTSKATYQFTASVALHRLLIEDIPDSKCPKHEWICATEVEDDKFLWLSVLQRAIRSSMEK